MTVRVAMPFHLRRLAKVDGEVRLEIGASATIDSLLDAMEKEYPSLRGTVRDFTTGRRRPLVRFFACGRDLSEASLSSELPAPVVSGEEPFQIIGAIAGG